jgi:hypothetical protein
MRRRLGGCEAEEVRKGFDSLLRGGPRGKGWQGEQGRERERERERAREREREREFFLLIHLVIYSQMHSLLLRM